MSKIVVIKCKLLDCQFYKEFYTSKECGQSLDVNRRMIYQRDMATGKVTYKPGPGLPLSVIQHVKPIYQDLSQDTLLLKCLHGQTQNQNESFNAMIWKRLPKTEFVSLTQLKFGTYDAVANFNIGRKSSVLVFEKLGMIPGRYTTKGCDTRNRKRILMAEYKNQESVKKRRSVTWTIEDHYGQKY